MFLFSYSRLESIEMSRGKSAHVIRCISCNFVTAFFTINFFFASTFRIGIVSFFVAVDRNRNAVLL